MKFLLIKFSPAIVSERHITGCLILFLARIDKRTKFVLCLVMAIVF